MKKIEIKSNLSLNKSIIAKLAQKEWAYLKVVILLN
jgi:hypothetical protein